MDTYQHIVPLKKIEYGIYGETIKTYPKPYSIYLGGTIVWAAMDEQDPRVQCSAPSPRFCLSALY